MPLERRGTVTLERVEWVLLESQVLVSWAEEACASSRALVARSRQVRVRQAAMRGSTRPAAGADTVGSAGSQR